MSQLTLDRPVVYYLFYPNQPREEMGKSDLGAGYIIDKFKR